MSEKLKAVVFGCGWGAVHMRGFAESEHARLSAIWARSDKPAARKAAERFGVPLYTDASRMFKEIKPQLASIAVPEDGHEAMANLALDAGCDVYCEKVLADSSDAAARMAQRAQRCGRMLNVGYNYRYSPSIGWMRKQVLDGRIGTVLFAQLWAFTWCLHHMTDAISSLLGRPRRVMGQLEMTPLPDQPHQSILRPGHLFERFAYAAYTRKCYTVEYEGGAWLQAGATDYSRAEEPAAQVLIQGSRGRLLLDDLAGDVQLWTGQRESQVFRASQIRDRGNLVELGAMAVADFARAAALGQPAPIPAQDGLDMIRLEEAIFRSARNGSQWEEVPR